jgi:hypothetical protein
LNPFPLEEGDATRGLGTVPIRVFVPFRHLERVLGVYVEHYNQERPHRGLALATPNGPNRHTANCSHPGPVRRRDLLAGLIHEYSRAAV